MLRLRAFVVLQTQGTMNLFLVIDSPTIATPLRIIVNLPVTNGLALRTDPEMIWTTPEMATTMTTTTTTSSMPRMS